MSDMRPLSSQSYVSGLSNIDSTQYLHCSLLYPDGNGIVALFPNLGTRTVPTTTVTNVLAGMFANVSLFICSTVFPSNNSLSLLNALSSILQSSHFALPSERIVPPTILTSHSLHSLLFVCYRLFAI